MAQYKNKYYKLNDNILLKESREILSDKSLSDYISKSLVVDIHYEENLRNEKGVVEFPQFTIGAVLSNLHRYAGDHLIDLLTDLLVNNYDTLDLRTLSEEVIYDL